MRGKRMLYYFSGTGNSEWVAKKLGQILHMEIVNISALKMTEPITIGPGETVGFICPTYAWAPAESMTHFMKRVTIEEGAFSFAVCTCESEAGTALKKLKKTLKLQSCYSIRMPSNYILGGDVASEEVIRNVIRAAKQQINQICEEVRRKEEVYHVEAGVFGGLKTVLIAPAFNKFARTTSGFYVEEGCNGCGLCVRNCPTGTITLKEEKPVWGNKCLQCLSCINRCPKQAIQYGKQTKNRGRYYFKECYETE